MSATAILLLLLSAVIHVGWNLTSKRQRTGTAFFTLANLFLVLALAPILLAYRSKAISFPRQFWALVAATGFFEALYYAALAGSYRGGEMSVTYPLVRAAPVLMVAGVNFLLGRSGQISTRALMGMMLVFAGCIFLPLTNSSQPRWRDYLSPSALLALTAAAGTTGYSLVDDQALRLLRGLAEPRYSTLEAALIYSFWQTLSSALVLSAGSLSTRGGRQALAKAWRKEAGSAFWTGISIFAAYLLVLAAMTYARNVSYVVAFRQISIPLGALAGILLLREKPGWKKLAAVGVIFAGLMMVGLG